MNRRVARGPRRCRSVVLRTWLVLLVVPVLAACGARGPGAEAYPELEPFEGAEVVALRFVSHRPFSADSLANVVETSTTRCDLFGLGICIPFTDWGETEEFLELNVLRQDVQRLEQFYRRAGFFGTDVIPDVHERGPDQVAVEFNILRGDSILVDSLSIEGVAGAVDTAQLRREMPLEEGELFDLDDFVRSGNLLLETMRRNGYARAEVLRNYAVDTIADRARVWLQGIPGSQVRIDSVVVVGGENLGRRGALQQMEFAEGDLLRLSELTQSQRNLFSLDLVQFATVQIAPDSLQLSPGVDSTATVLVTVSQAPVYVVEASAGYGTVDCLRARTSWTSRSFMGGARRLVLSGQVAKIGIADPVDLGLDNFLCDEFENDPFRSAIDYRVAADLTQPYFLTPRNRLNTLLFAEQTSEPSLYQRQAYGSEFTVSHRLNARDFAAFFLNAEYRRTRASDAVFCFAFAICGEQNLSGLEDFRWRNAVGATYTLDRANRPISPTSGWMARLSSMYSPQWLGSDIQFLRLDGEAAWYMSPRPDWVVATHLRLGDHLGSVDVVPDTIGSPGDLLPPEERFYAGGPTTVRGYGRNMLGADENPGVWVAEGVDTTATGAIAVDSAGNIRLKGEEVFVPLGGSALAIANAELRMPSPFLSDYLRFATFVDVGAISTGTLADISFADLRFTPGVGVRIETPVGPARLDISVRPHALYTAPLLVPDPGNPRQLVRLSSSYRPPEEGWFRRLQFHLAVGQPF